MWRLCGIGGPPTSLFGRPQGGRFDVALGRPASPKIADLTQVEIDHGRRIEREELRQQEAADDGDAERAPQLRAGAGAERERQAAWVDGERAVIISSTSTA